VGSDRIDARGFEPPDADRADAEPSEVESRSRGVVSRDKRYGARFRDEPITGDIVGEDEPAAGNENPRWLTRGGAVVAVGAVAALAFWTMTRADEPEAVARPEPAVTERYGPAVTIVRNTPPPIAPLMVTSATGDLWRTRGFSYNLELTNPTDTDYELVDIAEALHGTEMLWDDALVFAHGTSTDFRVDFLIINCVAVVNRAAPAELRLTMRPAGAVPGTAGGVAVTTLDLSALSAAFEDAGGLRCAEGEPAVVGFL